MNSFLRFNLFFVCLLLLGSGCTQNSVSSLSPEEAAMALNFDVGSIFVLRPTIFGVGRKAQDMNISITQWTAGKSVQLSWTQTSEQETIASLTAREAHETQYSQSPIGVQVPEAPEPIYESVIESGTIESQTLDAATKLELPDVWAPKDAGVVESSLIWISRQQYDELINTRTTKINLGLFDESLLQIQSASSQLQFLMEKIKNFLPLKNSENPSPENQMAQEDVLSVKADADWETYTLLVNGERTTVRTIKARNKFASYSILANPDNPLILEFQLTPLAQGNLNLLHPTELLEGFKGFEIFEMETTIDENN